MSYTAQQLKALSRADLARLANKLAKALIESEKKRKAQEREIIEKIRIIDKVIDKLENDI